ncbi:MAG: sigma-54 factor interaction domain-containing protein [bacterium]|nr:sigma-54 factor interaction domain-containing protein [bacterium]
MNSRYIFIPDLPEYKSAYIQAEIAIKGGLSLLIHGETSVGKNILGSNSEMPVDFMLISATNRDLLKEIEFKNKSTI